MYTLHKLPDGFIVTSDEEIIQNDTCLNWYNNPLTLMYNINVGGKDWEENKKGFLKVIAQQDQIDFSSLSEEEQKKIGWFDVDKLAELAWLEKAATSTSLQWLSSKATFKEIFKDTFQKAQELLSDRRFTEKDLKDASIMYAQWLIGGTPSLRVAQNPEERFKQIIESLSQPKSLEIEIEMEYKDGFGYWYDYTPMIQECNKEPFALRPKLTNGKIKITKLCTEN